MNEDDYVYVEVVVRLAIKPEADVQEVLSNMTYSFDHPMIVDHIIHDVITEL